MQHETSNMVVLILFVLLSVMLARCGVTGGRYASDFESAYDLPQE